MQSKIENVFRKSIYQKKKELQSRNEIFYTMYLRDAVTVVKE